MSISEIEAGIADALFYHLNGLTLSPALPVAWPGVEFTPPSAGNFLRAMLIEATPDVATLGDSGYNRHSGILIVFVHAVTGIGEIVAKQIASQVAAHFKRGTDISRNGQVVRIVQPPGVGGSIIDGDRLIVPVRIRWFADSQNPA